MPANFDWRSPTEDDYLKHLDRPGFAWEFLRRNPAYQEDYETIVRGAASDVGSGARQAKPSPGVGGSRFLVDPRLAANQVAVFWRPEMLPTIVLLERAPERFSEARPLDVAQLGDDPAERLGLDGRHVIVGNEVGEVRLWLRDGPQNEPLAIILPLDDDLPTRAEAALRLWTRIVGRRADHGREPLALTRQRCDRLVLMLRALDGHLSEASYREIAEILFGIRRLEREPWKTSSLRDQTIRLVKGGVVLMRAGYRTLLRGR